MKKAISIILAVLMVFAMAPAVFATDWADPISADIGTKTDVLTGKVGILNSPNKTDKADGDPEKGENRLTDGIICKPGSGSGYFNQSFDSADGAKSAEAAGTKTREFTIKDGSKKSYYYEITFSGLSVDVDSFQLWWYNEKDYTAPDEVQVEWHADAAFDILVSQDGGKTWSVAWESTRLSFKNDEQGNKVVDKMSAWTKENGGDWTHVTGGTSDSKLYWYRTISANFNKEYKGVTNIAYGCVSPRREGLKDPVRAGADAFYYVARISEFDVYGKPASAPAAPATGDNDVWFFAAAMAAATLAGSVVIIRRRRED